MVAFTTCVDYYIKMLVAKKHLSHEYIYKREVTLPVFSFLTHYKRKLLVMYSGTNHNAEVLHSYFLAKILGVFKLWTYPPYARTLHLQNKQTNFYVTATLRTIESEEFWKVQTPDVLLKRYLRCFFPKHGNGRVRM